MSDQAYENTDRELWRKGDGDGNGMSYYEPSIHVTAQGLIGIGVGGTVYEKPVEEWHRLAAERAPLEVATGDDPVTCGLCGKSTSIAMIVKHLADEHGIDPAEIADAPIVDLTGEEDEPGGEAV